MVWVMPPLHEKNLFRKPTSVNQLCKKVASLDKVSDLQVFKVRRDESYPILLFRLHSQLEKDCKTVY